MIKSCVVCGGAFQTKSRLMTCSVKRRREHERRRFREYHQANRERINERVREHREANRERFQTRDHAYYEANRERIRDYRDQNRERIRRYLPQWNDANREYVLQRAQDRVTAYTFLKQLGMAPDHLPARGSRLGFSQQVLTRLLSQGQG